MKVVHLSTSDKGGAGIAAMRLHKELMSQGIDSHMLTKYRLGSKVKDHEVFSESYAPKLPEKLRRYLNHKLSVRPIEVRKETEHLMGRPSGFEYFSFPFSDLRIENHPLVKSADILHLHWVSEGFINYSTFFKKLKKRIVWTLHDMNPFTGGCHHSDDCSKYIEECKVCPQLENTIDNNYAFKMQKLKEKAIRDIEDDKLKIVSPSEWLRNKSSSSKLFKRFSHYKISNGIDEATFYPRNKKQARKELNLPQGKKILLFVSNEISNKRKGIFLLEKALDIIQENENIVLCTLGRKSFDLKTKFPQYSLNFSTDENTIALAYSAADVFVLPSMAENFPNTICESLFCNTPVVAFNVGGISELIDTNNGILVDCFNIVHLADALVRVIKSEIIDNEISRNAIGRYSISNIAKEYIRLYN